MSISRDEYESILQAQLDGKLTIMIDTSAWRQFLCRIDSKKLAILVKRPVSGLITLIRFLSKIDLLILLFSFGVSILAFGLWSIVIGPMTLLFGFLYKSRASAGRQSLVMVTFFLIIAILVCIIHSSLNLWIKVFIFILALALFFMRLLYVLTSRFVFSLIHSSYELFSKFYLKPEGVIIPYIWTEPEFRKIANYSPKKKAKMCDIKLEQTKKVKKPNYQNFSSTAALGNKKYINVTNDKRLFEKAEELVGASRVLVGIYERRLLKKFPELFDAPNVKWFKLYATVACVTCACVRLHFDVAKELRTPLEAIVQQKLKEWYVPSIKKYRSINGFIRERLLDEPDRQMRGRFIFFLSGLWIIAQVNRNIDINKDDVMVQKIANEIADFFQNETSGYWSLKN